MQMTLFVWGLVGVVFLPDPSTQLKPRWKELGWHDREEKRKVEEDQSTAGLEKEQRYC